jgi:hypothetical protein
VNILLAPPDMMPKLAKAGRVLALANPYQKGDAYIGLYNPGVCLDKLLVSWSHCPA